MEPVLAPRPERNGGYMERVQVKPKMWLDRGTLIESKNTENAREQQERHTLVNKSTVVKRLEIT